jgi:hypothetical protein
MQGFKSYFLVQEQRGVRGYVAAFEEFAIEYIRDGIRTRLAAVQRNPGDNVFRDI